MALTTILPAINTIVFGLVALLHTYWATGGRWALANSLPQLSDTQRPLFVPGKLMALAVACVLIICMLINGQLWLPVDIFSNDTIRYGLLIIGLAFGLRTIGDFMYVGLTKRIRDTSFACSDTIIYTPLCAALSLSHITCFVLLT